jgi:hypothetical protein
MKKARSTPMLLEGQSVNHATIHVTYKHFSLDSPTVDIYINRSQFFGHCRNDHKLSKWVHGLMTCIRDIKNPINFKQQKCILQLELLPYKIINL